MRTSIVKSKTVYINLLNQSFDKEKDAIESNHQIHLEFRKYIQEELIIVFSDCKVNNLSTSLNIWETLDFTPECIRNIIKIMRK